MSDETKASPAAIQDEPPKDEEGLLKEYDAIICGTGLVQSIVASALTRAGQSVLHCDGLGYYGELNAVLSLPYLQQGSWKKDIQELDTQEHVDESDQNDVSSSFRLHPAGACHGLVIHSTSSKASEAPPALQVGTHVTTIYGNGVVQALATDSKNGESSSLAVSMSDWKLADGTCATAYFPGNNVDALILQHKTVVPTDWAMTQEILKHASRSFALDVSPRLLYASGKAVTGLLTSSVADYLEFKSMEGLLWMSSKDDSNNDSNNQWTASRVPCSKGDVFSSKLLKPMDKRRLMKFLQLALDYAIAKQSQEEMAEVAEDDDDDDCKHETSQEQVQSVNERQLNQGRSLARPQNKAVSTDELQKLQQCIQENMDFDTYLTSEQKLSPQLKSLVKHALALATTCSESSNLEWGIENLCKHVQALGRYGTTAFLIPLYGSGELPQSFCRSAAVHGGTYLLRRAAKQVVVEDQSVRGIVLSGAQQQNENETTTTAPENKTIRCKHVIASRQALVATNERESSKTSRILRRISVLRGKLIPNEQQRHVLLFPPGSVSPTQSHAIHGVVLDDSVQVSPGGCTVLHLTTTVNKHQDVDDSILERAVELLLSQTRDTSDDLEEIYHVCFSHVLSNDDDDDNTTTLPDGLHLCQPANQSLVMDGAFEQAKEIFDKICPDVEFLTLSERMDTAIKERIGDRDDNEDDEKAVLQSAMNMMEISPKSKDTASSVDEDADGEEAKASASMDDS